MRTSPTTTTGNWKVAAHKAADPLAWEDVFVIPGTRGPVVIQGHVPTGTFVPTVLIPHTPLMSAACPHALGQDHQPRALHRELSHLGQLADYSARWIQQRL